MENSEALNKVFTELEKISEHLSEMITTHHTLPEEGLRLVASQLELAGRTLKTLQEMGEAAKQQTPAVAEETVPVNIKEVVGMSLENTAPAPVEVKKEEPAPPAPVAPAPVEVKPPAPPEPPKVVKAEPVAANKQFEDIKSMIGLNQKFAFIKLFGGDTAAWNDAVQQLNGLSTFPESEALVAQYRAKYGWDAENEAMMSLIELLGRRFL